MFSRSRDCIHHRHKTNNTCNIYDVFRCYFSLCSVLSTRSKPISERARYECAPHAIRHSLGLSYEYLFLWPIVHAVGYHVLETCIQTPFASSCRSFRHSAKAERRIDEGKNGFQQKSEQQHDATSNFRNYSFCLAINLYIIHF